MRCGPHGASRGLSAIGFCVSCAYKPRPHSIALGCAVGVFAVFTPFLGLQMMLGAMLALALRGSVVASAVGSFAGNPLTCSIIWVSTFTVGNVFLDQLGQRRDQQAIGRRRSPRPQHKGRLARWRRHRGSGPVADPQAHGARLAAVGRAVRAYHLYRRSASSPMRRSAGVQSRLWLSARTLRAGELPNSS